jgi:hypothetical protein
MIGRGGQTYTGNPESWSPTMTLAFIHIDDKKILHQWWISSAGRSEWRPVVEISRHFAETGTA